jgi:hypothetical protein
MAAKSAATMTIHDTLPGPLTLPSRRFFMLWNGWRDGALLPARNRLDTDALDDLLPRCVLIEIRGGEDMPIRFAGSWLRERLGGEIVGTNYLDLTQPENRRRRADLLLTEVAQPCAAVIYYWVQFDAGGLMPVEVVSAPLLGDTPDAPPLVLACASPLARGDNDGDADPSSYAEGDGLQYIDIGAGLPPAIAAIGRPASQVQ